MTNQCFHVITRAGDGSLVDFGPCLMFTLGCEKFARGRLTSAYPRDVTECGAMAQLVISNAAQIKLHWSSTNGTWMNVLGALGAPALPVIDQTLANGLQTDAVAAMTSSGLASALATTTILERTSVRDISAPNRPEFISSSAPRAGAGGLEVLPLSVAAVLSLRTAAAGRSFRGRIYFSGFDEEHNDAAGRMTAPVADAIKAFMDTFAGTMGGRGLTLAVLSPPRDAVTIPARTIASKNGFATGVTLTLSRNLKWESQRRRTGRE